jgi:hypothetical protein
MASSREPAIILQLGQSQNPYVVSGPQYMKKTKFEKDDKDVIMVLPEMYNTVRAQMAAHFKDKSDEYKFIHIVVLSLDHLEWDMIIHADATWDDIKKETIKAVKTKAQKPEEIIDVEYGLEPFWFPHGKRSKVIDTRDTASTPMEQFQDGSIIHVVMFHRQNKGWIPTSYGLRKCDNCNKLESQGKLKKCAGCDRTMYCNEECQRSDWRSHKKECKEVQKEKKSATTRQSGGRVNKK